MNMWTTSTKGTPCCVNTLLRWGNQKNKYFKQRACLELVDHRGDKRNKKWEILTNHVLLLFSISPHNCLDVVNLNWTRFDLQRVCLNRKTQAKSIHQITDLSLSRVLNDEGFHLFLDLRPNGLWKRKNTVPILCQINTEPFKEKVWYSYYTRISWLWVTIAVR